MGFDTAGSGHLTNLELSAFHCKLITYLPGKSKGQLAWSMEGYASITN